MARGVEHAMSAKWCAICADDSPGIMLTQEPLGKAGALVWVCADCNNLHPSSGRYSFGDGGRGQHAIALGSDGRPSVRRDRVRR